MLRNVVDGLEEVVVLGVRLLRPLAQIEDCTAGNRHRRQINDADRGFEPA